MVHLDVQQNLDEVLLVVEHLDVLHPLVAVVDAELRHLLRMDCCLGVAQLAHPELAELVAQVQLALHLLVQMLQQLLPALLREMP